MIHLNLGAEPDELREARRVRLPRAMEAFRALCAATSVEQQQLKREELSQTLKGYREPSREALYMRQHGKCAWCERRPGQEGNPIDHVRPKGSEPADPVSQVRGQGYWWLTWTWENLLFSCARCNTGWKGHKWSLREGSPRIRRPEPEDTWPLPDACFDLTVEERLLVDPRMDDPLRHLEWGPVDRSRPVSLWTVDVSARDEKGQATLDALGLKHVREDINVHLKSALWPYWPELQDAKDNKDRLRLQKKWKDLCDRLLRDPDQPFRGPIWYLLMCIFSTQNLEEQGCVAPARPMVPDQGLP